MPAPRCIKTTCPYCGVGCGVLAEVAANGDVAVRGDPDHPANFGRLCSKGAALAETIDLDDRLLYPHVHGARTDWDAALDLVAGKFNETIRDARPGLGRLLCLGPVAHRGLLRRQQADERLHRLGQHRYQFAPVHGVVRRRTQARLRLRHGARLLRGSRARRPRRARRLQPRLVPSGALPAHRRRQGEAAGHEGRADRSAPHGHRRHRRPAPADQAGRRRAAVPRPAALPGAHAVDQAQLHRARTPPASRRRLRAADDARPLRPRAAHGASRRRRWRSSSRCSPQRRRPSPSTARASTNPLPAPTRSTPSSTATWRPAASASPAWGRSRSPASPTRWAGARSAASPTCSPRTWTSRTPTHRDRVQRFWRSPTIAAKPGLKAVDMFRAVADGRIKALWIMATNPVVSMPEAENVEAAIRGLPVRRRLRCDRRHRYGAARHMFSCRRRHGAKRTAQSPTRSAASRASAASCRHRATPVPIGGSSARSPAAWGMAMPSPIRNRARSSPSTRRCPASRTAARAISTSAPWPASMAPTMKSSSRCSGRARRRSRHPARMFADGRFFTPDAQGALRRCARDCRATRATPGFPLTLNTGRVRDHWHTMTRTGKSAAPVAALCRAVRRNPPA